MAFLLKIGLLIVYITIDNTKCFAVENFVYSKMTLNQ